MSATKWTPGPHFVDADEPLFIVTAEGSSLGEATAGDPFIAVEQQLANARLWAAASDLYAALERSRAEIAYFRRHAPGALPVGHELVAVDTMQTIDAALARARGES